MTVQRPKKTRVDDPATKEKLDRAVAQALRARRERGEATKSKKKGKVRTKLKRRNKLDKPKSRTRRITAEVWQTLQIITTEFWCPICKKKYRKEQEAPPGAAKGKVTMKAMDEHYLTAHNETRGESNFGPKFLGADQERKLPEVVLHWHPLPPGALTDNRILKHYQEIETEFFVKHRQNVDRERIKKILSLRPDRAYRGPEEFLGYLIYEFKQHKKVILECPIYGNAVYLLYRDSWQSQANHSKQFIRENYPGSWARIFHTENWFARLRLELSRNAF
jgi:hypothetical protein